MNLQTDAEWHIVFYISAGIYLVGCAFYGFAASGDRQPWADPKPEGTDANKRATTATRDTIPLDGVSATSSVATYGTNNW